MAVRTVKVEIFGFAPDRRDAWKHLAVQCQRMTNRLWQIWLCHHAGRGSAAQLRDYYDGLSSWLEDKTKQKPIFPCKAADAPLTVSSDPQSFYRILSAEFPDVNVRTRGLLTNAWQSLLGSRKAATGSKPGWVAILLGYESLPSFTRPLPIPFDHDNAKLMKDGSRYVVELRIERLADSGKSVVERCELMLRKRKSASVRAIMDRILDGQYKWKGSNLLFDRGKWFVVICYEMPAVKSVALNPDKTLFVRPGRMNPWRVMIGGESWNFGGNGVHVEHARRAIIRERNSRKQHYRWAGSNQKGRGDKRAMAVWTKLHSRWRDFTKRYNHEVTRQLINLAKSRGCGRIVYLQPKDRIRSSRLLSRCGNDDRSSMLWDYFQFGSLLAAKCEAEGIEYGAKPRSKPVKHSANRVRRLRKIDAAKQPCSA